MKTLNEYAAEVAALINGKVAYTGPNSAVIIGTRADGSGVEIGLDGPACRNWRVYNEKLIALLKASGFDACRNVQVDARDTEVQIEMQRVAAIEAQRAQAWRNVAEI